MVSEVSYVMVSEVSCVYLQFKCVFMKENSSFELLVRFIIW